MPPLSVDQQQQQQDCKKNILDFWDREGTAKPLIMNNNDYDRNTTVMQLQEKKSDIDWTLIGCIPIWSVAAK